MSLCLAPELSEETFPTLLLISKLMKVKQAHSKTKDLLLIIFKKCIHVP